MGISLRLLMVSKSRAIKSHKFLQMENCMRQRWRKMLRWLNHSASIMYEENLISLNGENFRSRNIKNVLLSVIAIVVKVYKLNFQFSHFKHLPDFALDLCSLGTYSFHCRSAVHAKYVISMYCVRCA